MITIYYYKLYWLLLTQPIFYWYETSMLCWSIALQYTVYTVDIIFNLLLSK